MNRSRTLKNDIDIANEHLAKTYYASVRYFPALLVVAGLGILAIYFLTQIGIFGEPAPQLLYVGGSTLLFAITEIPTLALARLNRGIAANVLSMAAIGLFAILLTGFWEGTGIMVVSILLAVVPPVLAFRAGMPRKYLPGMLALVAVIIAGILYVNANPLTSERLQSGTPAAIATIIFFAATSLLLLTDTVVLQNRRFQSLQGLLLSAFVIIVTIPTVMTAVLTAIGAYSNNQTQAYNSLQAITVLKENQIETLLNNSQSDAKALLSDQRFLLNSLDILTATGLSPTIEQSFKRMSRSRMVEILGAQDEAYNEIMVLNTEGNIVISTIPTNEGKHYEKQSFFKQGLITTYVGFADEPSFGVENLIVATPIFAQDSQVTEGILVLRSNGAAIREIMENTPGFSEAETYLVDLRFRPVTKTRIPTGLVQTKATLLATRNNVAGEKSIYMGYARRQVLGYYEWFQPLQLAIVAEVPLSFVVSSSVRALAGSALLAFFVVAVAIAAVVISARTISDPITTLAKATENFAAGELSARAVVDRRDEIGDLAKAYNQMATQLQDMIGKLEQRVTDRTQDLEGQSLRLRVAAEIARDSASAKDLHELLARAAELICNRFGFYHTGIFLLDSNKQYAVLVASPTEAGRKMIENNHKLRVGEIGIVGRVAATGEPRITLNTGADVVYFNNPYLPSTNSEMALPLKVENNVIGVLDVQSDQAEAFNEDDVAIMQILADQLATAIERARLLQEVQRSLHELEGAYGRFTGENWRRLTAGSLIGNKGYRFDNIRLESVTNLSELAETAFQTGNVTSSNGSNAGVFTEHMIALPIKLRGQTIGVVNVKLKEDYDHNTMSVIEAATERLAAAMESARLYEEARLRADREEAISRVTTAISASTEYEHILQSTVRELGSILNDTEVAIQILDEPASAKRSDQREQ